MTTSTRGAVNRRLLLGLALGAALALGYASSKTCLRVGLRTGLWLEQCPDGDLRQAISVQASELKRGAFAPVTVGVEATYVTAPADRRRSERVTRFTPQVSLLTATGETQLALKQGWAQRGDRLAAEVELPKVNDGDYTLRTRVTSPIGEQVLDLPLPLYTPARVHVLTDRPLYEPGNTVRFRALALRASDLSPLEERPGTWRVTDPEGQVLLEERAPSGPWGVVSGSFPLDRGARSGAWSVSWTSGATTETRTFTVKPFTLPRFRVEASPVRPFAGRGERPVLKGAVTYSSGAPVANAVVELDWSIDGAWPAPTSWVDGTALPKKATTTAAGAFVVELPPVPMDLQGQATLTARLAAVDPSGDRVEGSATVLLSEDAIQVTAVSELRDGLVEGFNNRLFLRATTADGRVLEGVTLNVKRLWEPTDPGTDTAVDEDGVGMLQVDPGPAVNVVIPAMPFRPPPPTPKVARVALTERLQLGGGDGDVSEGDVSLADRMAFDRLDAKLAPCARFVLEDPAVSAALLVRSTGAVSAVSLPASRLGRCVEAQLQGLQLPPGKQRFFDVQWQFNDEDLPGFDLELEAAPAAPAWLQQALADALLEARDCLPANVRAGPVPRLLEWTHTTGAPQVALAWLPGPGEAFSEASLACITSRVRAVDAPRPEVDGQDPAAPRTTLGIARISVDAPEKYEALRPQDTVMVGYEFLVTARQGSASLGRTKLRMRPGSIPPIRLRASAQLVSPGEHVKVEVLRGPDFTGALPDKLLLTHAWQSREAKLDEKTRTAEFDVPADWQGWAGVQWGGGQVHFFIQPRSALAVKLTPEKPRYAPGQVAQLGVETTIGGAGGQAAVGLFGVDDSLSQLAPLPGADELAGMRPQATGERSFGSMDAQALSLGRVRGKNAAAATLARVSALPGPPEQEAAVTVSGATVFDPNEAQVDRFYVVLGELYAQVRDWEAKAPEAEKMTPPVLARLWNQALDAVAGRKEPAVDAWGRRLRLHRLPVDLLALTEPRQLVVNGTRLPEDTQNWAQWVARERP